MCAGHAGGTGTCDLGAFLMCEGMAYDACWLPDRFDGLVLTDLIGQRSLVIRPADLGLQSGFSSNAVPVPDLDGDGSTTSRSPRRESGCDPDGRCFIERGAVALVSSSRGGLMELLRGRTAGALYGQGLAASGDTLAIGAPGEGVVYLYRLDAHRLALRHAVMRERIFGQKSDLFGADIAPALGETSADPSFLVGASEAFGGAGELLLVDASRGITESYPSPVAFAFMSRGVVVGERGGRPLVVAALPGAFAGDGALAFFTGNGPPSVRRGESGARLGDALVALERDGEILIVAAAPGGDGAVHTFDLRGNVRSTTTWYGSLFGTGLSSPGDLDGDGRDDLVANWALDPNGEELRALPIFELNR